MIEQRERHPTSRRSDSAELSATAKRNRIGSPALDEKAPVRGRRTTAGASATDSTNGKRTGNAKRDGRGFALVLTLLAYRFASLDHDLYLQLAKTAEFAFSRTLGNDKETET